MDIHTAPQRDSAETAEGFNYRIGMENKKPIHAASKKFLYIRQSRIFHTICCYEANPVSDAETAADILLKQWILFGLPEKIFTDKGT